jgi:hypothetical protein
MVETDTGAYRIMASRNTNQCLYLTSTNELKLRSCSIMTIPLSSFKVVPSSVAYQIKLDNNKRCLTIPDLSDEQHEQPVLQVCKEEGNTLDKTWILEPDTNGNVAIRHQHSDICIDVPGGDMKNGAALQQFPCHGGPYQQWKILVQSDNRFKFQNVRNQKCFDYYNSALRQLYGCSPHWSSQMILLETASNFMIGGSAGPGEAYQGPQVSYALDRNLSTPVVQRVDALDNAILLEWIDPNPSTD